MCNISRLRRVGKRKDDSQCLLIIIDQILTITYLSTDKSVENELKRLEMY